AQVSISGTATPPDSSAMLDIQSDTRGLLIPRMDSTQRQLIANPAEGLLVFDTDTKSFWFRQAGAWAELTTGSSGLQDLDRDTKVLVEASPDADRIRFVTRDSLVMVIDSTGHIGIGDTMPGQALTLRGANMMQLPATPKVISDDLFFADPNAIYISGQYAYVVRGIGPGVLFVIDVTNPAAPETVSGLFVGSNPVAVFVSGRYAYIVDQGSDDLKVIDVSNPNLPTVKSSFPLGFSPADIFVSGHYVYIIDNGSDDLKVIDVSNPVAPVMSGSLTLGAFPVRIYVYGRVAYVVDQFPARLQIIDISDPQSPAVASNFSIGGIPTDVFVSGPYAYLATQGSLLVVDVSDPSLPSISGSLTLGTPGPCSIHLSGRYAYCAHQGSNELKVIDVSLPDTPTLSGSLTMANPSEVFVSGRYAYVLDNQINNLSIIDISGGEMASMLAHSLEAGNLQVRNDVIAQGQVQVTGGLTVGVGGIFSDGDIGLNGNISAPGGTFNTLGIGTDDPGSIITSALLEVNGGHIALGTNFGIFSNHSGGTGIGAGMDTGTDDELEFWSGGAVQMTIDEIGRVGIGTPNPEYPLHIDDAGTPGTPTIALVLESTTSDRPTLLFSENASGIDLNDGMSIEYDGTTADNSLHINAVGGAPVVTIESASGQVGIGTTSPGVPISNTRLDVRDGHIAVSNNFGVLSIHNSGTGIGAGMDTGPGDELDLWSGGAVQMSIDASGFVGIGTTSPTALLEVNAFTVKKTAGGTWSASSDIRLKQDIRDFRPGLQDILQIRPVNFRYNALSGYDTRQEHVGVIAQELQEVAPYMVSTFEKDGEEYLEVDNSAMIYMLINAVQELEARNALLEARLATLEQVQSGQQSVGEE
ncbi:MAG: tail fiber domain-containing protein, partial [Saprospiraceae bacterium]|nr:tail fiber domain-containing protein [Saprospiraceae bacterium]